jgi:hypothetical protein
MRYWQFRIVGCISSGLVTLASGCGGGGGQTTIGALGGDPVVSTLTASIGPIHLMPGDESTKCITMRLANAEPAYVRRFSTLLGAGSHHMVLYRSTETAESLTPKDCPGFSGVIQGQAPLFIAQQAHVELALPKDEHGVPVGLEIEAKQMVTVEAHVIDSTMNPIDVTASIQVDTVPLSSAIVKTDLVLAGTISIDIPPNGEFDSGVKFQPLPADSKVFALTTHQHRLGTDMKIWYASGPKDTQDLLIDSPLWNEPKFAVLDTPLSFPAASGQNVSDRGFTYDCRWKNPTAKAVTFGESFYDEMCFLFAYYYPSQGFEYCFDGDCHSPNPAH